MMRLLVLWFALSIVFIQASGQLSNRGARCTPLDPTRDSIPHPDSDPDCKIKPYPDYFSRCTCSYFVARKLNGCPSHFFILCTKNDDPRTKRPQIPKFVQEPIRRAEILPPAPLASAIVDETSKNVFVPLSKRREVLPPIIDRQEIITTTTPPIGQGQGLGAQNGVHKLVFKPIRPEFEKIAPVDPDANAPTFPPPPSTLSPPSRPAITPPRSFPRRTGKDEHQADRPDQCPADVSGCIFDDEVEGTDCTVLGSKVCQAVGADYCSAGIGFPVRRVCCKVTGVDRKKQDENWIGCPSSNGGCIFEDYVHGADCTHNGTDACTAVGADYCGAVVGGQRFCCSSNRNPPPHYRGDGTESCLEENSGCIFNDLSNTFDCSEGGNALCAAKGTDYCGAWFGFPLRRACCTINRALPTSRAASDKTKACPPTNSGCIFDDVPTATECTFSGNAACNNGTGSYCSAYFGQPLKRVCCKIN